MRIIHYLVKCTDTFLAVYFLFSQWHLRVCVRRWRGSNIHLWSSTYLHWPPINRRGRKKVQSCYTHSHTCTAFSFRPFLSFYSSINFPFFYLSYGHAPQIVLRAPYYLYRHFSFFTLSLFQNFSLFSFLLFSF